MSEKLSKKELLKWLDDDDAWEKAWNHLFDDKFNRLAREQIRSLIKNRSGMDELVLLMIDEWLKRKGVIEEKETSDE